MVKFILQTEEGCVGQCADKYVKKKVHFTSDFLHFLVRFFNITETHNICLWIISKHLPDHKASHPRRQHPSQMPPMSFNSITALNVKCTHGQSKDIGSSHHYSIEFVNLWIMNYTGHKGKQSCLISGMICASALRLRQKQWHASVCVWAT
jgi:hypothetical protein